MKIFNTFFRIAVISAAFIIFSSCTEKDKYISFSGLAQGGTYTIKLNLRGADGMIKVKPEVIQKSVESILEDIDNSLSGYNKNSLLNKFNEQEVITPDKIFIDMYSHAYGFYEETEGVIDAASAPLFDLWGFGFKNGEMPTPETVARTQNSYGMGKLRKNITASISFDDTIESWMLLTDRAFSRPKLNFNALAQGYSCDLVAEYLYSIGVKDMMVDIGEIFCDGLNPSGQPWSIGIDKPVDGNNEPGAQLQGIFRVPEGAHGVVTSGNYRKFYIRDGKKYAHTIDPRTGYPVEHNLLSATIVANDALTADAYATYCMVVGLEEAQKFLESRTDLEGCLIYDDNGTFRTWCSEGFVIDEN